VRYRKSGTTTWTTLTQSSANVFRDITGLTPATTYQWNVRSKCNGGYGTWGSGNSTFTTLGAARLADESTDKSWRFSIHPNPSSGQFTITPLFEVEGVAHVKLMDMAGRIVLQQTWNAQEEATLVLNERLEYGIYVLTISANRNQFSERLIIGGEK
jgi:hypothetical protein